MSCKPGVAGSIPGFSITSLSVDAFGSSRHIINTQIINPPGPVLVSTHGKATKSFLGIRSRGVGDKPMSCKPGVAGSIPGFSIKPLTMSLWVFP